MAFQFTAGERHVFARQPYVPLSEWAARNLIVRDGPHAGGRYRRDVNPYLVGIMDAWSAPGVEEVVVCGSAQTGKTLVMHAALCYCVARRPGPRMLAMQDDDAMGKVAQLKLLPMFRSSPGVRGMLGKVRAQRIGFRDGTSLFLASAQSPGQRASISIQDLFLDEEALYKQIAGQGVPVAEFKERTRSYARKRKILRVSKPIGGEECSIAQALSEMDELRHYLVRCPACQAYQPMIEDRLVLLEKGASPREIKERRLGRYRCAECGYLWTDYLRDQAVQHGHWEAEEPVSRPRSVGFLLPAILSANVSISEVVAEKVAAERSDSPATKQQYINGMWALPFRMVEMESKEEEILSLVDLELPPRTVPGDAVALTAGIDRLPSSRMRIPGGLWLYLLDTHYFKGLVFGRLRMDAHQPMTLHSKTDETFARQITAEVLERDRNGHLVWKRLRKSNHYLDCVMMADACVDGSWLPSFQLIVEQSEQQSRQPRQEIVEPVAAPAPARPHVQQRPLPARPLPARQLPGRPAFMQRGSNY